MSQVPDRIDLPLRVATAIVLQGLRIRLGRSLVTVSGVLLGIAFLTSTATTYLVKDGVQEEDAIRDETNRMLNFFVAELGTLEGKTLGLQITETPTAVESRVIARLQEQADQVIPIEDSPPSVDSSINAIIVIGSRQESSEFLSQLSADGFTAPIGVSRLAGNEISAAEQLYLIPLSTELTAEERKTILQEKATARYRTIWILAIALVVTLMGITNSMLMSVSERFREIGTMKCLGATSRLVRRIFLIESLIIGISGGLAGAIVGALFSLIFYSIVYGPSLVLVTMNYPVLFLWLAASIVAGVLLTVMSAVYPANLASSMVPATALRSNV